MKNALTIDVEDYFQVIAFERFVSRDQWAEMSSRVVQSTTRILRLLDRAAVRATFFVLGWVAARFPGLVRDIVRAGHEVGSHGYWHQRIYTMTPDEFRADLVESRDILEDIVGRPVVAFRAPCFSVTRQTLWALDILADEGFRYDSSIFPVYHDRYGIPDANPLPHRLDCAAGSLIEFPASVVPIGPWNLPVAGGGYFRLFPWRATRAALRRINNRFEAPFVFYIHPWELDPDQPRLPQARWNWRHYVNLSSTEDKFASLLETFEFDALSDVANAYIAKSSLGASNAACQVGRAEEFAACA
jgi:polysaccharide deacetylase family protein (PEP-CTERM system associated)